LVVMEELERVDTIRALQFLISRDRLLPIFGQRQRRFLFVIGVIVVLVGVVVVDRVDLVPNVVYSVKFVLDVVKFVWLELLGFVVVVVEEEEFHLDEIDSEIEQKKRNTKYLERQAEIER